jgi:hypothetical protein
VPFPQTLTFLPFSPHPQYSECSPTGPEGCPLTSQQTEAFILQGDRREESERFLDPFKSSIAVPIHWVYIQSRYSPGLFQHFLILYLLSLWIKSLQDDALSLH